MAPPKGQPSRKGMRPRVTREQLAEMERRITPGERPGPGAGIGGIGQQPFIATPEQREAVMALISVDTPKAAIARMLRLSEHILDKHFKREIEQGKDDIFARVGGSIVADALNGDKTMRIFFAKARMGWRDRAAVGFEDKDGNPTNPPALFTVHITS